jgi:hypothetical protein
MTCPVTLHLGVYALGAVDDDERHLVETHLPGCAACQAELALLTPLPRLLATVPGDLLSGAAGARTGPAVAGWDGTGRRAAGRAARTAGRSPARGPASGRRRSAWTGGSLVRSRKAASVAVATAAAAAGLAGGLWLAGPHRAPAPAVSAPRPAAITLSGSSQATHVQATAVLTATSWGTRIELRVRGLPLNKTCRLIVRSRDGQSEVSGVWDAWRAEPITVPASAGWLPSDIASLQVVTASGSLLTMPAPQSPAARQSVGASARTG